MIMSIKNEAVRTNGEENYMKSMDLFTIDFIVAVDGFKGSDLPVDLDHGNSYLYCT